VTDQESHPITSPGLNDTKHSASGQEYWAAFPLTTVQSIQRWHQNRSNMKRSNRFPDTTPDPNFSQSQIAAHNDSSSENPIVDASASINENTEDRYTQMPPSTQLFVEQTDSNPSTRPVLPVAGHVFGGSVPSPDEIVQRSLVDSDSWNPIKGNILMDRPVVSSHSGSSADAGDLEFVSLPKAFQQEFLW